MLSLPKPLIKGFIRRFLHFKQFVGTPPAHYRRAVARVALPPPLGVRRRRVTQPLPGEWLEPSKGAGRGVILYLHGGAYVFGSAATHREFAGRLARLSRRAVFLPEYRLAPEHPFPAAHDDARAAFRMLLALGHRAEDIAVVGDSAGGGLALSLALGLRDAGEPLPAKLVLLSPWTDLVPLDTYDADLVRRDPMIDPEFGKEAARAYYTAHDPRHPLISPLYAALTGLPPMLIHVGTEEVLLPDSQRFAERARAAGLAVDLQVWPGMWHVWHLFGAVLPEARRSHEDIVRFLGNTHVLM